jgi:predicted nucleic acid-binding protein
MQRTPTNDLKTAEILYGISALSAGRRRTALAAAATAMFAEDFAGRILPFEARAAARYPNIVLARRQAGNSIEKFDVLIAATTLAAGASIATRDAGGSAGCGPLALPPPPDRDDRSPLPSPASVRSRPVWNSILRLAINHSRNG